MLNGQRLLQPLVRARGAVDEDELRRVDERPLARPDAENSHEIPRGWAPLPRGPAPCVEGGASDQSPAPVAEVGEHPAHGTARYLPGGAPSARGRPGHSPGRAGRRHLGQQPDWKPAHIHSSTRSAISRTRLAESISGYCRPLRLAPRRLRPTSPRTAPRAQREERERQREDEDGDLPGLDQTPFHRAAPQATTPRSPARGGSSETSIVNGAARGVSRFRQQDTQTAGTGSRQSRHRRGRSWLKRRATEARRHPDPRRRPQHAERAEAEDHGQPITFARPRTSGHRRPGRPRRVERPHDAVRGAAHPLQRQRIEGDPRCGGRVVVR